MYIFQLMDFYAASGMSLLWCTFFQTIAICWIFGAKKMYNCIELMVGYPIPKYWLICWVFVAPAFMAFLFLFYFIKYTPITYGKDYAYPQWGEMLGFMISLSSMVSHFLFTSFSKYLNKIPYILENGNIKRFFY